MLHKLLLSVGVFVALSVSCKSKEPASNAGDQPAEGSAIVAEQMGTFTCMDVKNDVCLEPTDRFAATVPVVHVTYKTKDLPENGGTYVIKWIAEDVGAAAPANTVIATLNEPVKDVQPGVKNYVVNSRMSKPTEGWPVGKYRVEVSYGDKLVTTAKFSIQ
ncbi:MAG: hypothetical protein H0T89_08275 [Deltaproteobacteria bacterium]|nr:hypothetical protein [Deltaproteobacteria bacterium]MDQ3301539.1 hypothetical protein [Myxococcota bacterium]